MAQVLHAWVCENYIGRFERAGTQLAPTFVYDDGAEYDLSLSVPRDGEAKPGAPGVFLEALLPETPGVREKIQQITGAATPESWDLLAAIGGDLQGGLVLHPDSNGRSLSEPLMYDAHDGDIADRILQIRRGGLGYSNTTAPPRFSVAGAQAKFTLARTPYGNFWTDAATPSSHIIKPETREHDGLELIEAATLALANRAGVPAPRAEQVAFAGETAFQIARFDRGVDANGVPTRLHAEDMTQALGFTGDKYHVDPDEVVGLLRLATGSDEEGYSFYRQYIFNVLIGNADAHGKNYSIIHTSDGIKLSPLYDSIPLSMFPDYSAELAMPVDAATRFRQVTPTDWDASARASGLDPDRVADTVSEVAAAIHEHLDSTLGAIEHRRISRAALDEIREALDRQTGVLKSL